MDEKATVDWFVQQLSEIYEPEGVAVWMNSPHQLLNGDTALERIRAGRADDVQAIISQLLDVAYG